MNIQQTSVFSGLGSDIFKAPVAGMYYMSANATELPVSGLVLTLSQSGSTTASISSPVTSPIQQVVNVQKVFNCAIGDILTMTSSSSAPGDQPPNMIKIITAVRLGL